MKNARLITGLFGLGSVLTLTFVLNSSAFAGPSPAYWAQRERERVERTRVAEAAKPVDRSAIVCPGCTTTDVREARHVGPPSKGSEEWTTVGSKHACSVCGGASTVAKGKTTNTMKATCPICVKAAPGCCGTTGHVVAVN